MLVNPLIDCILDPGVLTHSLPGALFSFSYQIALCLPPIRAALSPSLDACAIETRRLQLSVSFCSLSLID